MSQPPNKPEKPDFSKVKGGFSTTAEEASVAPAKADFSKVKSGFTTTASEVSDTAANTTYTVKAGDSLSKIAKKQYGNANAWKRIFDANRDQLDNPDLIQPGQVLIIPPAPTN